MNNYKAVLSGMELGRRVADSLEATAPVSYLPNERPRAICATNDILQGRSARSADELLVELEKCGEQIAPLLQDIRDFLRQKELLSQRYDKNCRGKRYVYHQHTTADRRSLKIIDQKLYDRSVKSGFPPDFFRESYFDQVTFYCLPDHADFYGSMLTNCKFAVCRLKSVSFIGTQIYSSEFYSSVLNIADFFCATLAHTHFHDCELSHIMLQYARMRNCNTIDCTLFGVNYSGATLDGCTFGRVTAGSIRNLDGATIIQGGATEEECRRNRDAIYQALGVKQVAA